ncbi:MAG: hypothetical protein HUK22_01170, partial [Thermoguttaceae bacterium]|nr:hypothetical protein [Thermoguttaceae bacterium]
GDWDDKAIETVKDAAKAVKDLVNAELELVGVRADLTDEVAMTYDRMRGLIYEKIGDNVYPELYNDVAW